jgi:uncharacterized protein (TIGR02231 family)
MKTTLFVALVLGALVPAVAGEIDVRSAIDAVTVYPDGATVIRHITVDLPAGETTLIARDFPPGLDAASLRVEGESATRIVIGAIDARAPRPERPASAPEIEKRIETLQDERGALDDRIAAAAARKKFAERFAQNAPAGLGDKGEARPLAEWRAAFAAVADEIATADGAIREAKLRQREIERELIQLNGQLIANPARKMEVRIDLAADAGARATFRVSYAVRGARWVPHYDARLDTGTRERKPALELIRRAEILQQTGEDWNDVALTVSTVRTAKGGSAPELRPLIVRYPEPARVSSGKVSDRVVLREETRLDRMATPYAELAAAPTAPAAPPMPAQERETVAETGGFQAVFRVPGRVSASTNEGAKSFRIATAKIAPELFVRATPALDETAYLEAMFKQAEDAPLLPGRVAIYRDGIFVGRGQMALTSKDETVRLGFGADDKVKVARATVRRNEGSTGIISSAKTDEREFKITVRNGHDTPIKVMVEDQLPVSEIADVQVELLPVTTAPTERDTRDRRGVLSWMFDAAAGENREIKLAWRVRWPADKTVVFEPRRS